jgi:hypothetical protein
MIEELSQSAGGITKTSAAAEIVQSFDCRQARIKHYLLGQIGNQAARMHGVFRDADIVNPGGARGWRDEIQAKIQRRRFTSAISAKQTEDLPGGDVQIESGAGDSAALVAKRMPKEPIPAGLFKFNQ